jgi:alkylation response protein AidB-like acyl-CoA dehydrogenase
MMIPERMTSAAGSLGVSGALDLAVRYSDRRRAFGKQIRKYQAVSFIGVTSVRLHPAMRDRKTPVTLLLKEQIHHLYMLTSKADIAIGPDLASDSDRSLSCQTNGSAAPICLQFSTLKASGVDDQVVQVRLAGLSNDVMRRRAHFRKPCRIKEQACKKSSLSVASEHRWDGTWGP